MSILLIGAAAGCGSGSSAARGAAANLDYNRSVEDPTTVSCPSASFCMAVDARDSSAFLFNGSTWSSVPRINDPAASAQPGMASVSCASPTFCAAVDYGPDVVTFNGTAWSKPFAIDPAGYLQAVSCAAAGFCVAIDRKGNALTYNGISWSAPVNADPNGLSMGEGGISWPVVSCRSASFCAAGDSIGDAFVRN